MKLTPNVVAKAMLKGNTEEEVYAIAAAIEAYIAEYNVSLDDIKKDSPEYEDIMESVLMNSRRILKEGESNVVD